MKNIALKFLCNPLLSSWTRIFFQNQPLVVLYHGVTSEKNPEGIINYRKKHVHRDTFEKEVQWLSKHFTIVPLRDIEKMNEEKNFTGKNLCAITFDDGYRNNYLNAFPILKKYNVPATIFLTTGFVDRSIALWTDCLEFSLNAINDSVSILVGEKSKTFSLRNTEEKRKADLEIRAYLKTLPHQMRMTIIASCMEKANVSVEDVLAYPDHSPLSWEEIQEMERYQITFGAHTKHHPILSKETKERQREEIMLSVERVRSTIGHCKHFAYPNGQTGDWNDETKSILKELGVRHAWTTESGRVGRNKEPLELPRITLDNTEDVSRFRGLVSNTIPFIQSLFKK